MNPKVKFMRFLFALLLALSALGISTSTALADKPVQNEFPFGGTYTITDVCSFDFVVVVNPYVHSTDFYDKNGTLTRTKWHVDEQDTFTANGKTLVGMPFTFNLEWSYDSDGNWTGFYADGVVEKVPLPDGSLFISAGRIDWMNHLDTMFLLSADKGNPGNVEGFCAALSP
jgi:hypothetical protein